MFANGGKAGGFRLAKGRQKEKSNKLTMLSQVIKLLEIVRNQ
jgi:hypothetical protein